MKKRFSPACLRFSKLLLYGITLSLFIVILKQLSNYIYREPVPTPTPNGLESAIKLHWERPSLVTEVFQSDVINQAKRRVVTFRVRSKSGVEYNIASGVMLDSIHIITAKHAAEELDKRPFIVLWQNKKIQAEWQDRELFPDADLAILKITDTTLSIPRLAIADYPNNDIPIFGFNSTTIKDSIIAYLGIIIFASDHPLYYHPRPILPVEAEKIIVPGMSGSGVFNYKGELIGITVKWYFQDERFNYSGIIPANYLAHTLKR